ncbi:hypothetical protein [Dyadobacter psychrophilus]|uniref:Uncharacterized protein n=1 Tax=Dyadobacter psychrophilus TaxID=651661 RepID=A0A1T5BXT4_9BACT|nr:hypothetical protein [Dyadobacter psychrophilus]SKB51959.1 hypothetical protein SAMN05660293_00694 [Dyadobacter psychrophilus]
MSAEWWMRGEGPMLKTSVLSKEEADSIIAENKAIKALCRAELMGKPKGAILCPDGERETRKHQFKYTMKSLRGKRNSKSISVCIPEVKVPSLSDLSGKEGTP